MHLDYLVFDYTPDDEGNGSFDAMATVSPPRWPALQAEVQRVLAWAHSEFAGLRGPLEEGGQWDFELQGVRETPVSLDLRFEQGPERLLVADGAPGQPRITVSLTLSGTQAFCSALRDAFAID